MNSARTIKGLPSGLLLGLGVLATFGGAHAYEATSGGWQVNLDTTLSSSVDFRTSDRDYNLIGIANGGKLGVANTDNGNLNFAPGKPVAATQRITTELQVKQDDYGVFVRATGFYDPISDSERTDFQPLSRAARRDIGADLRLLDAYAYAHPSIFGHAFDVRVGAQALNWGESTFIQFGINSINPLDVTALRTPGSELRQGFLPIPAVDVRTDIGGGLSLEGFWQFAWTRSKLEPDGSFFSTNDTVSDGGTYGNLSYVFPDNAKSILGVDQAVGSVFGGSLPRSLDRHSTSLDQFGFALRKTFASMGDTELGLYFENYHSRTPFGSFHTGRFNISGLAPYLGPTYAELPRPFQLASPAAGKAYADLTYSSTASYFADYPGNIHLVGVSWNAIGPDGIAVQGEVSSRLNQPIQFAASDTALLVTYPAVNQSKALSRTIAAAAAQIAADPATQALGLPGFNQILDGWKRYPVIQAQTTATKLFAAIPSLSISSLALVGEVGADYVAGFPRERGVLQAPYTTDINSAFALAGTVAGQPLTKRFEATQFSAAYTVAVIVDMPNVLPYGIDMKPTISLQHDFVGTSPVGVNIFQQNTAAGSVGVTLNYLQAWSLGVQYTNHFPIFDAGKYYGLIDRDFVSAVLSYEF